MDYLISLISKAFSLTFFLKILVKNRGNKKKRLVLSKKKKKKKRLVLISCPLRWASNQSHPIGIHDFLIHMGLIKSGKSSQYYFFTAKNHSIATLGFSVFSHCSGSCDGNGALITFRFGAVIVQNTYRGSACTWARHRIYINRFADFFNHHHLLQYLKAFQQLLLPKLLD